MKRNKLFPSKLYEVYYVPDINYERKKMEYFIEKYLQNDWGLIPLIPTKEEVKNSGKTPAGKGFLKNPVKSPEVAQSWWGKKHYNIGIVTGKMSGIIVLDIDKPDIFESFLTKHPECRNTYIVRRNNAPEWRCHYYFRLETFNPGARNINSTGWGDILSDGKYVVAPPSLHYSGGVYEIVNDVPPLPFKEEYIVDLLLAPKTEKKKVCKEKSLEITGVAEGRRNSTLFLQIKQMRDDGCSQKEAEVAALRFCQNCEPPYDKSEALKTVSSVYTHINQKVTQETLAKLNFSIEPSENQYGEIEYKRKPLGYDIVVERIKKLLHYKVANINNELVVLPENPDDKLFQLRNSTDLFGYLGTEFKGTPDWISGKGYMTREELFSTLLLKLPEYASVEKMPHYPYLRQSIYVLPDMPKSDIGILNEFLDFFSPETSGDRNLILSMFLTTLWGGPAGQRAPFIVTSKDGRGVGKSTLAETAAKLLNQVPIQASTRLDSDGLTTRLLSWDAMKSRIVLFDNEVATMQKISNAGMAALFTTSAISGKRLYKGEGSRPNYLVWIMTLNSVTFDSDFASRCIPISLKRPSRSINWQERLNVFIENNRWILISTMLELLQTHTENSPAVTRWGLWENQVLSKVPGINKKEVLDLIVERQKQNDNDLDEKEMIIDSLMNLIRKENVDISLRRFFISNADMADLARDSLHLKQGNAWILKQVKDIIAKGDYPALRIHKTSSARGFIWDETVNGTSPIVHLSYKTGRMRY